MVCPNCQNEGCRRSHRRGKWEHALGLTGLRPWRCPECQRRFFGWRAALVNARYAHCRGCGNLEVQRISSRHMEGELAYLWRAMKIPAYRCTRCRKHFFSLLKVKQLRIRKDEDANVAEARPETADVRE